MNLNQTDVVYIFNMRDHKSIGRVNSDTDVVVRVNSVFIRIDLRVVNWVHFWILFKSKWKCFNKYAHNCYFFITFLQRFSHFFNFCDIQLFMQVQMRNCVTFRHRFLHTFLITTHRNCCDIRWRYRGGNRRRRRCIFFDLSFWFLLGLFWLVDHFFNITFQDSTIKSASLDGSDIKSKIFNESSYIGCRKDSSIYFYTTFGCLLLNRFSQRFIIRWILFLNFCRTTFPIFPHNLKKQISNLTNLLFLIIYLFDNSGIRSSNFRKLFIRSYIG